MIDINGRDFCGNNQNITTICRPEQPHCIFWRRWAYLPKAGIKHFRGVDGLYHLKYKYNPETILSRSFFQQHPEEFFEFYQDKIVQPTLQAQPNTAHHKLAQPEQVGKLTAVVTQNIDGLHQMAGSKNVLELHGSIHRNYCASCGKKYPLETVSQAQGIPRCQCAVLSA